MPTDASALRLFLALCPGAPVRAALAAHAAQWRWNADARRYAPADWHLTLHFLGALPAQRLDELRAGLDVPAPPFTLRFGQAALWPQGLAVLLPARVPPALVELHARLGLALRALGLAPDARAYRPHLTLARHAGAAVPPAGAPAFDWPVRGYALLHATGGATERYRVLRAYGAQAA